MPMDPRHPFPDCVRACGAAALLAALAFAPLARGADPERQAEVARRGTEVMPFSLEATTHVFTRTADGGLQRVVVRSPADPAQVRLVREHLRELRGRFLQGDFSGPQQVHGPGMPGLAELAAARPGQLAIDYREVEGGAELAYRTTDPGLVVALHRWFEAQLSDHGAHAMAGHAHASSPPHDTPGPAPRQP